MHHPEFTFHHVSIKSPPERIWADYTDHSHSTMYLLKLVPLAAEAIVKAYSHSTMYLLKL